MKKSILQFVQNYGIFFVFLFFTLFTQSFLFFKEPHFDESVYSSVIRTDQSIFLSAVPHWREVLVATQPFFFILLKTWFSIIPFSFVTQRLLATVTGILVVFCICIFVSQRFPKSSLKASICLFALFLTPFFLQACQISRPEIFVLFFGWFGMLFLPDNDAIWNWLKMYIVGILHGLAFFIHLNGVIFIVSTVIAISFKSQNHINKLKYIGLYAAGITSITLIFLFRQPSWLTSSSLLQQLGSLKNLQPLWYTLWLQEGNKLEVILAACCMLLTGIYGLHALQERKRNTIIFLLNILGVWVFTGIGKSVWYTVYLIPFLILASEEMISQKNTLWIKQATRILLIFIICLNGLSFLTIYAQLGGDFYNYDRFSQKIEAKISDNSVIFLSTIPELYYGLHDRSNITLIEYPALGSDKKVYVGALNKSDYIVYNGTYNSALFGDLLEEYIKVNELSRTHVGSFFQYQADVIRLKPKEERRSNL
jgi:hypothetical protein